MPRAICSPKPALVTPMTMMVLAIRLYDVGLRDDAVFWFYVAKDRYIVLSEVLNVKTPQLAQADDAVRNFATLAAVINGYAFCDLARQKAATQRRSSGWKPIPTRSCSARCPGAARRSRRQRKARDCQRERTRRKGKRLFR